MSITVDRTLSLCVGVVFGGETVSEFAEVGTAIWGTPPVRGDANLVNGLQLALITLNIT